MSVLAVGVDLVEIDRIATTIARHGDRFLDRVLTAAERAYCLDRARTAQHVAARVAVKEAAFKALQEAGDASRVSWLDIEVVSESGGRPRLAFTGRAEDAARRLGAARQLVSISHSRDTAVAVVVLSE